MNDILELIDSLNTSILIYFIYMNLFPLEPIIRIYYGFYFEFELLFFYKIWITLTIHLNYLNETKKFIWITWNLNNAIPLLWSFNYFSSILIPIYCYGILIILFLIWCHCDSVFLYFNFDAIVIPSSFVCISCFYVGIKGQLFISENEYQNKIQIPGINTINAFFQLPSFAGHLF